VEEWKKKGGEGRTNYPSPPLKINPGYGTEDKISSSCQVLNSN